MHLFDGLFKYIMQNSMSKVFFTHVQNLIREKLLNSHGGKLLSLNLSYAD